MGRKVKWLERENHPCNERGKKKLFPGSLLNDRAWKVTISDRDFYRNDYRMKKRLNSVKDF